MAHYSYLGVLGFVLVCAILVNYGFRLRFLRRWRTFLKANTGILLVYLAWDFWAIAKGSWKFDPRQVIGINLFNRIPLEEILFFIVVPMMVILCFLALQKLTLALKERGSKN